MHSRRVFLGISAIVFVASAAMTIAWCGPTPAMGAMDMPGGATTSTMWMRMPGQSWLGAAAEFVGIWVVMMMAMMMPSLTPALSSYREALGTTGAARRYWLTALVAVGYFVVWAGVGVVVWAIGAALARIEIREPAAARLMPMVVGAAVLAGGILQQTAWKSRRLVSCREAPGLDSSRPVDRSAALRHGLRLGVRCSQSCAGLTTVALALGIMDLRVMAAVAVAITVERLAPNGVRIARAIGVVVVVMGLVMIARGSFSTHFAREGKDPRHRRSRSAAEAFTTSQGGQDGETAVSYPHPSGCRAPRHARRADPDRDRLRA